MSYMLLMLIHKLLYASNTTSTLAIRYLEPYMISSFYRSNFWVPYFEPASVTVEDAHHVAKTLLHTKRFLEIGPQRP